jgi:hypothetical protein
MDKYNLLCISFFSSSSLFAERGDNFDWEELVDEKTEQLRAVFNERLSGMNKNLLNMI